MGNTDAWVKTWLVETHSDPAQSRAQLRGLGGFPLKGEIAVWHSRDDIHKVPRLLFDSHPQVNVIRVDDEIAAYLFRTSGEAVTWRDLGNASTETDRFFLVQADQIESVLTWFSEDPLGFENLDGDSWCQTIERGDGTCVVVIESPDGNAHIRAEYTADRQLAAAIIAI